MFRSFASQAERRNFGGSDFIEIQFCRMPQGTEPEIITATDSIHNWQDDSLYVPGDDAEIFLKEYAPIFLCGIYNNLKSGPIDPCGINYYPPGLIDAMITKLWNTKPEDYEVLTEWLNTAKKYNGFYILGE